ncbi:hypothetical protein M5X00_13305 [Paenibacillus alvei]|uniref:hypothetical protein n=1 Tax=Paenibacillus alvei TaxID=44250 RepID=UPI000287E80A|nr:hypothetical protein [Paenibacillus alvei]EJW13892.1 hypothetical protein PAV_109p01230 [Paenibacillus alvei DSM 29]MCY9540499.1 hypothetical protein [Paenibacillus alvei]MCY9708297.1 hypothetical protein [Paenibacillus alvei]MCY9733015.1 hypothetical protein [Paenibacillus alvei]MCY9755218.1 hypothetical protein [Paenibacillus alvei]
MELAFHFRILGEQVDGQQETECYMRMKYDVERLPDQDTYNKMHLSLSEKHTKEYGYTENSIVPISKEEYDLEMEEENV